MLIEFSVANYRSFRERQRLSLVASSAKEHRDTNTFSVGIPGVPPLLRSAAIYGPNAAGKTNLLKAIHFMQQMVLTSATLVQSGQKLNVKPFLLSKDSRSAPSEFEAIFVHDGTRYQFGFSSTATEVVREWLIAYPSGRPQRWFERSLNRRTSKYAWKFGSKLSGRRKVWQEATRPNALFLSTAVQLNNDQLRPIFNWFQERLTVVVPGVEFNAFLTYSAFLEPKNKASALQFLHAADLGISDIEVKRQPLSFPGQGQGPVSAPQGNVFATAPGTLETFSAKVLHRVTDAKDLVSLDMSDESDGTQKLFQAVGAWLKVLSNGSVAFVDELDSSLHPKIVRFLIELFNNSKLNEHNAQLVFSTHDTSVLAGEIFRRDQIWFVEKTRAQSSSLYALSDFSPRKNEALERNYLKGRYGALPIIGEFTRNG